MPAIATISIANTATPRIANDNHRGLTTVEAQARLKQFGPNAVAEEKARPLQAFLKRFWAPIPWLLEATIIIQIFLREKVEAAVIGGLLILNAGLSLAQEGRSQKALALLRQQLRVLARVRRDDVWTTLPAEELVPGDIIHLRQGTIVPADVKLENGSLLVDQSALTGESAAASLESGKLAYAGSMVRGGEATGEVTTTGTRTFFGKTAELVRTAGSANRQEHEIAGVVKNLLKGAPAVIAKLAGAADAVWQPQAEIIVDRGQRVLGVAQGTEGQMRLVGLLGLEDAVREDSKAVVSAIRDAGVRTVMVTGDNAITARSVAEQVGISGNLCSPEKLRGDLCGDALDCGVFAGVFPEDKFRLVRGFQRRGEVVGMNGDGVNDAPALRQAEVGVAVANATDVAKAAAAMVLTRPGLEGVVPAIETSRLVFQRIITYTLNMLIKKIEIMALLVIGFLITRHKPITPLLMVLFLFLNDFLTMSLSTDRMQHSRRPNRWNTRGILVAASVLAACKLVFSLGVFLYGDRLLRLDMPHLQTLVFATLILSSQAGVYLLRERGHFWQSRPSRFLVGSSVLGLGVTVALVLGGILMPALGAALLLGVAGLAILYFTCLGWLKVWLFARLNLR